MFEREHVFGLIILRQGTVNGFKAFLAADIANRRQCIGITFAGDDSTDDLHTRDAGDRSNDVMKLNAYEGQRLLHMLDMRCGVVRMLLAGAMIGTQLGDIVASTEAGTQQFAGM